MWLTIPFAANVTSGKFSASTSTKHQSFGNLIKNYLKQVYIFGGSRQILHHLLFISSGAAVHFCE
jgi:hypothetical protein